MNLRSGMSVQDLKMLTAQREHRIMMEQFNAEAQSSPRSTRSLTLSDTSSTGSSPIASPMLSPRRASTPPMLPPQLLYSKFYHTRHHHVEPRVLLTYGGQMVSVMEGVRNIPEENCCFIADGA
ncbi:unnamed protein product [Aphanomyces euteiches]